MDNPGLHAFAPKQGFFEPKFALGDEVDAGALEYLSSSGAGTLEAPARIRFNALGQVLPDAPSGV